MKIKILTTKTNSNIIISYYRYIYFNTIYNIGTEERNSLDDVFFFFFRFRHIKDVKYKDRYNNACSILTIFYKKLLTLEK